MINFVKQEEMSQVIKIWQDCFNDTKEEVERFFSHCYNSLRVCVKREEGKVVGFLCLLDTELISHFADGSVHTYQGEYIYAVATDIENRNRGICSSLLEDIMELLEQENKFGILVPADQKLAYFYEQHGFVKCYNERNMIITNMQSAFSGIDDIKIFHPISLWHYLALRKKEYVNPQTFVEPLDANSYFKLQDDILEYAVISMLSANTILYGITVGGKEYGFICEREMDINNDMVLIRETTATEEEEINVAVCALLACLKKSRAFLNCSYMAYGVNLPIDHRLSIPYHGNINLIMD